MKKIISVIIVLAMMLGIGVVAFATNEEPLKDYEKILIEVGFERDPDDDALWVYKGIIDGMRVNAFYDGDYDSGAVLAQDIETGEIEMYTIKWCPADGDFEDIAEANF